MGGRKWDVEAQHLSGSIVVLGGAMQTFLFIPNRAISCLPTVPACLCFPRSPRQQECGICQHVLQEQHRSCERGLTGGAEFFCYFEITKPPRCSRSLGELQEQGGCGEHQDLGLRGQRRWQKCG